MWHGGCGEGVASTLEQAETHQVCEVPEGILQVQRLMLHLPAQLPDTVTSSCLGCLHQRVTLHVLRHPAACPHLPIALLGWERSSCDSSFCPGGACAKVACGVGPVGLAGPGHPCLLSTTALLVGVGGSGGRCLQGFSFIQHLHDFSFCVGGAAVCQTDGGGGWEDLRRQQPHAPRGR